MTYEHFVELLKDQVQIAALSFMALIYAIKIYSVMKKAAIKDRTPNHGNPSAGMRYSLMTIVMPWQMQSYRDHPTKYIEFAIFHLAIAVAISSTLIIPYFPNVMLIPAVLIPTMILCGLGLLCGLSRMIARIISPTMRLFSSPDDYFSIFLLNAYLASALLAIPNSATTVHDPGNWTIVLFFGLTTFFLIYVPFSKISHYVLWPFNRYLIGKHFGKRGVYPKHPESLIGSRNY
jgi:hypothetical protein